MPVYSSNIILSIIHNNKQWFYYMQMTVYKNGLKTKNSSSLLILLIDFSFFNYFSLLFCDDV